MTFEERQHVRREIDRARRAEIGQWGVLEQRYSALDELVEQIRARPDGFDRDVLRPRKSKTGRQQRYRVGVVHTHSRGGYSNGCRCAVCVAAQREYERERRRRNVAAGLTVRGKPRKAAA